MNNFHGKKKNPSFSPPEKKYNQRTEIKQKTEKRGNNQEKENGSRLVTH